jgi:hypothetical protein
MPAFMPQGVALITSLADNHVAATPTIETVQIAIAATWMADFHLYTTSLESTDKCWQYA